MDSKLPYELIVAMNPDGIIGITDENGRQQIPWHVPEDMRIFREKTRGLSILVMGRKTFESLPNGPLKGRIHVVITNNPSLYHSENEYLFFCKMEDVDFIVKIILETYPKTGPENLYDTRVFICGGADIYGAFIDRCNTLHITIVHKEVKEPRVTKVGFTMDDLMKRFLKIDTTGRMISNHDERMEYEHVVLYKIVDKTRGASAGFILH